MKFQPALTFFETGDGRWETERERAIERESAREKERERERASERERGRERGHATVSVSASSRVASVGLAD